MYVRHLHCSVPLPPPTPRLVVCIAGGCRAHLYVSVAWVLLSVAAQVIHAVAQYEFITFSWMDPRYICTHLSAVVILYPSLTSCVF